MKVGEICLCTNDTIKLANFYKQLLGVDNESNDSVHQFILSEETTLTIFNDGTVKNNNNQNICLAFTVDDIDKHYARLIKLGVPILEEPKTQPWGARNMHFCDPDGNHIYFRSFPSARTS